MRTFRILVASALLVLGLMAVSASSASAAPSAGACEFTGLTGTITPGQNPPNTGIQNWVRDLSDLNATDTDSGTYTFSGRANCTVNGSAVTGATITSSGNYVNILCSTGSAEDTAGVTKVDVDPAGPSSLDATGVKYRIDFAAGVGPLNITAGTYSGQGVTGKGAVAIQPDADNSGGTCAITDVTRFKVEGGFAFNTSIP